MNENNNYVGQELLEGINTAAPFMVDGVVIGMPFHLKQLVDRYGKYIIPSELGIYHLFYHNQLVYVGMSKNIRGRLMMHLKDRDMPFTHCLWFCAQLWKKDATIEDVLKIEYKMIKKYKPVLNTMHCNCR